MVNDATFCNSSSDGGEGKGRPFLITSDFYAEPMNACDAYLIPIFSLFSKHWCQITTFPSTNMTLQYPEETSPVVTTDFLMSIRRPFFLN